VTTVRPDGALRPAVAGAATGGLAMATAALVEILRSRAVLQEPWADLSRLALGGAAAGLVLGALRGRQPRLSPGAIVLGGGIALRLALNGMSGEVLTGAHGASALLRAIGLVLGGALIGAGVGSVVLRRAPSVRPGPVASLAIVALLALPLLVPARVRGGSSDRPNVLLLTIDTLRADRLGFAGSPVPTSPNLDRLARRGLTRSGVVTPLPRTLPAVASLQTGCLPQTHGVRDNFHYALGRQARTLAEILSERGWVTAAVNSNPLLSHDSGVYQGFVSASDRGDDWSHLDVVRGVRRLATLVAMRTGDRARIIADLALRWLAGRPRGAPFFLWVHWLSPHMPYEPEPPFDRCFDPAYHGRFATRLDYHDISKGEMTYRNPLTPEERAHAKTLYDGEVATADRAVGRLLRGMELSGDLDDTVILVTADHGESLDENGYFFNHGDFVYGPATNIPFLLVAPGEAPAVDREPMSLIDVAPTLLSLAGVSPDEPMDGRVPAPGPRVLFGESGFCRFPDLNDRLGWLLPLDVAQSPDRIPDWKEHWEAQANRAKQRFVQSSRWKLVLSPRADGDRVELFDLVADPGERRDLAGTPRAAAAPLDSLRAGLDAWIEAGNVAAGTADRRELTDEQRARLDALGYLGN
jgi:arylsulfatase A-like enzyme